MEENDLVSSTCTAVQSMLCSSLIPKYAKMTIRLAETMQFKWSSVSLKKFHSAQPLLYLASLSCVISNKFFPWGV